jgi:hypothetical protein
MLARYYIGKSAFSGVDVLRDETPAARERLLDRAQQRTDVLGFGIFLAALATFLITHF